MSKAEGKKMAIASRLALARKNAGLSQGQSAKLMEMHRPSVSEIEAGRRNVSAEELAKFAEIYGVSVGWLACEETDQTNEIEDEILLAARNLAKLKKEDVQKVLDLLTALAKSEGEK
ncbi:MAG: helix-turn-helix transcriptional regulator [Calditrichaceae bacterium]|nr:helix-turn-helix transcriptional regulator [Calditrichia bacterium]NUQ44106.1 helix-turn-helix transcriptional regulator [Calditrichaceae bacterium]